MKMDIRHKKIQNTLETFIASELKITEPQHSSESLLENKISKPAP
jgi:hypothetical protein